MGGTKINPLSIGILEKFLLLVFFELGKITENSKNSILTFLKSLSVKDFSLIMKKSKLGNFIQKAIKANYKTGYTFDLLHICPFVMDRIACCYCYCLQIMANLPAIILSYSFDREVLKWTKKKIERINDLYNGIRMFSRGDFFNNDYFKHEISLFLADCLFRGLKVKVITKQIPFLEFLEEKNLINAFSSIQISIDIFQKVNWEKALFYAKKYKNVTLRLVVLYESDIEFFMNSPMWQEIGIITLFHGNSKACNMGKKTIFQKEFEVLKPVEITKKFNIPEKAFCCYTGKVIDKKILGTIVPKITCQNCKNPKCNKGDRS